jgi:hypothetical protein
MVSPCTIIFTLLLNRIGKFYITCAKAMQLPHTIDLAIYNYIITYYKCQYLKLLYVHPVKHGYISCAT